MRGRAFFAAWLWIAAALAGCSGANAHHSECDTNSSSCKFTCEPGDTLHIEVSGPAAVSGAASCGGESAACNGTKTCTDQVQITVKGDGTCSMSAGTSIKCVSSS